MVPANGAASINYRLRSEVSVTLHHQPVIYSYTNRELFSVIKVASVKNTDNKDSIIERKPSHAASRVETTLNSEKINSIPLAIVVS